MSHTDSLPDRMDNLAFVWIRESITFPVSAQATVMRAVELTARSDYQISHSLATAARQSEEFQNTSSPVQQPVKESGCDV
jgi:hypothetical protein